MTRGRKEELAYGDRTCQMKHARPEGRKWAEPFWEEATTFKYWS